jgi:hypothetical protein
MAKKTQKNTQVAVYPEKGTVADEKALKKLIKGYTDLELMEWATLEGLTWKPCDHESINRMRVAMAIKELHFPSEPKAKKSDSPYKKYTTEQLIEMAVDNNIPVEPTDDMKIMRMRTIMMLRAHGLVEAK